jgi:hypothetical protein
MAETITLWDGTPVNVPEGLTDGEITNYLARTMPNKMIERGIAVDIEREFDLQSGVGDFGARFGNALASGNPDEIKAEFDGIFGKGNWGIADFSGQPFVTPGGLRAVGIEPKDDRKVMLDGTNTSVYDLVDIIPEAVVGAGALAAEIALPFAPGTGAVGGTVARGLLSSITGRGLIARSARAGFGDAVANVGLEGVQKLRGTQRESLGEVLQDAGTEGLIVGLGSVVLGAPFAAVGSVGNRIKAASKDMAPGTQNVPPVQITEMLEAQNRNIDRFTQKYMTEDRLSREAAEQAARQDAMLLSLRTLVGEEGTVAGNILTKIEGLGTKQLGDSFAKRTMDFMNKFRSVALESKRLGDLDATTVTKLKTNLSKSDLEFADKIMKQLTDFDKTPLGVTSAAAGTLRGFKELAEDKLLAQYRRSMKAFEGEDFYGQFKNIGGEISPQRLANFLTRVSEESGIGIDEVVNSFGPGNPLHSRITSRVNIRDDGRIVPVKDKRKYADNSITVQDLLEADKKVRQQAYAKRANLAAVRKNLEISAATQNQLSRLPEVPSAFQKRLKGVNEKYSKFVDIYRGKNGLFEQVAKRNTDDSQQFLTGFVNGREGAEFATLLDKLERAFGEGAVGGSIGLETKEQILGALGVNFIRENRVDVKRAFEISREAGVKKAADALKKINTLEATMVKRVGDAKAKQAMKQLFQQDSMKEYKALLNQIAKGSPESAARAQQKLGLVMNFKEAEEFVGRTADVGANLAKSDLDTVVAQLRSLDALDKRSGEFYRDLMFSENWGRVVNAMAEDSAAKKNAAIKAWADDWIAARSGTNGVENMTELFGKEIYEGMDDLAMNIRGALNIDPNAGALSVAEQPVSIWRNLLQLDFKGAIKPLTFMYGSKQIAPGTKAWTDVNMMLQSGKTPSDIMKDRAGMASGILGNAQKAANGAMSGRNGLMAAAVSSYMNEADQTYPTDDEVPMIDPRRVQEEPPEQPMQQSMIPADTGIAAIQQIASMIQGVGTSGLEEGAAIARSAA